jgi:hypothetical protein
MGAAAFYSDCPCLQTRIRDPSLVTPLSSDTHACLLAPSVNLSFARGRDVQINGNFHPDWMFDVLPSCNNDTHAWAKENQDPRGVLQFWHPFFVAQYVDALDFSSCLLTVSHPCACSRRGCVYTVAATYIHVFRTKRCMRTVLIQTKQGLWTRE